MRSLLGTIFLAVLLPAQPPSKWQAATVFPGVDMKRLAPAQQKVAIAVLRENACPCGCPMQLAQCRVEDTACGQSFTLANMVIEAAAAGKTAPPNS